MSSLGRSLLIPVMFFITGFAQKPCPVDLSQCMISGSSAANSRATYYIKCDDRSEQIEYSEGDGFVIILDPASRRQTGKCDVAKGRADQLIRDYKLKAEKLEHPECYLTQWKGQMMYVTREGRGRCSFDMNQSRASEFKKSTGSAPTYQCENGFFLVIADKKNRIYRKSKSGWELLCEASIRVGEPPESVDWRNPPSYYVPDKAD